MAWENEAAQEIPEAAILEKKASFYDSSISKLLLEANGLLNTPSNKTPPGSDSASNDKVIDGMLNDISGLEKAAIAGDYSEFLGYASNNFNLLSGKDGIGDNAADSIALKFFEIYIHAAMKLIGGTTNAVLTLVREVEEINSRNTLYLIDPGKNEIIKIRGDILAGDGNKKATSANYMVLNPSDGKYYHRADTSANTPDIIITPDMARKGMVYKAQSGLK